MGLTGRAIATLRYCIPYLVEDVLQNYTDCKNILDQEGGGGGDTCPRDAFEWYERSASDSSDSATHAHFLQLPMPGATLS